MLSREGRGAQTLNKAVLPTSRSACSTMHLYVHPSDILTVLNVSVRLLKSMLLSLCSLGF